MSSSTIEIRPIGPAHPLLKNGQSEQRYNQKQFDAMDNRGLELVDGKLEEKGMGARASNVGVRLRSRLFNFVEQKKLGIVFDGECGYHMFPKRPRHLRKPDSSFVAAERMPRGGPPEGWFKLAPDFAVEVVSPNELATKLRIKIRESLAAGVRLIWVIDPVDRTATVYRPGRQPVELEEKDTLSGEDVLPGFSVRLADILVD